MISIENISKSFNNIKAVNNVTTNIKPGSIYGLIGSNGAGKSTLLRLISGIYYPDTGVIKIDEKEVLKHPEVKSKIFYISDDQFFFNNSSMEDMANYFQFTYPNFMMDDFHNLATTFKLDINRSLNTFSKGMQKQAHMILALSTRPDYLLCDETFDGLDPVMRLAIKKLLADAVARFNMTPIIASHNLRELEDICDYIGLLHQGGLVFENDIDSLKISIHKLQIAFNEIKSKDYFNELDIVSFKQAGKLCTLIIRGEKSDTESVLKSMNPLYSEIVSLSLEEIFITEMEGLGYEIDQIFF